jgi:hypothetical protein
LRRVDLELAVKAARNAIAKVDIEPFDAAAQIGHRMRGEGGIDAGSQRPLISRSAIDSEQNRNSRDNHPHPHGDLLIFLVCRR